MNLTEKQSTPNGLEQARQEGREAYAARLSYAAPNLYVQKSYRKAWNDGWWEAHQEHQANLECDERKA